jgi:superfamily II DNA or RNA helicase
VSEPLRQLPREEVQALKFAAHRQLARWAQKPSLRPRQREQRKALVRAVRSLEDPAFAGGCELHPARDR